MKHEPLFWLCWGTFGMGYGVGAVLTHHSHEPHIDVIASLVAVVGLFVVVSWLFQHRLEIRKRAARPSPDKGRS